MSPLAQLEDHPRSVSIGERHASCATCHDADPALASAVNEPVPIGGANLDAPGFPHAPSLRYVAKTPTFSFDDGAPVSSTAMAARPLAEQAQRPFLAAHETERRCADVSDKLSRATMQLTSRQFGSDIFDQPEVAFDRALTRARTLRKKTPIPRRSPASTTTSSRARRS
jgi:cytochrome c peroxidase